MTPHRFAAALAAALLCAGAAGCAHNVQNRGYVPRADELDTIQPGVDTRETVAQRLGTPSNLSTFDSSTWYYISTQQQQIAFYAPENINQKVVAITFDSSGRVAQVDRYDADDARDVDVVARQTETGGKKLTILQQMFSNLGRFNTSARAAPGNPSGIRRPIDE